MLTLTSPNEVEIVVKSTDESDKGFKSVEKSADALSKYIQDNIGKAGKKTAAELNSNLGHIAASFKTTGQAANKAGDEYKKAGDKGKESGDKIKDALKDTAGNAVSGLTDRLGPLGDLLGKLGPAGTIAGVAMGAGLAAAAAAAKGLEEALKASVERLHVGALIGAQGGGIDPKRIAQLGKLAGQVYADNFGESLEAAGTAVRDVIRNHLLPDDAVDSAVKAASEKLLTLGTVTEAGTEEVARSVKTLLNTGLVKTADEAFDLIAKGAQNGLNVAGDLLDTLDEYPTQLRKLGLDAQTSLGLLQQGLKAGARDTDIVADALKEFSIRAVDGSKQTADGFKRLGLDGKKMAEDIAAGGARAEGGLQKTLDKLRAIKDPVQRAQIAVELFGTQAEDLGAALYALDPSKAVATFGAVKGAADDASKALSSGLGNELEQVKRKIGQKVADIGDAITPYVQKLIDNYSELGHKLSDIFAGSTVPRELKDSLRDIAERYGPAVRDAFSEIADKVRENKPELEELGHVLAKDVIPFLGGAFIDSVHVAAAAIGGMIDTIGLLVDSAKAMKRNVEIAFKGIEIAAALALLSIAEAAADAFGWIPGLGPKLNHARDSIKQFVVQTTNELNKLNNKDINVNVYYNYHTRGQSLNAPLRTGGIPHAAAGGAQDGMTVINEEGQEAVRLPTGSIVYPHANADQMRMRSGGQSTTVIEFRGDDSALWQLFMRALRVGDVQVPASAVVA